MFAGLRRNAAPPPYEGDGNQACKRHCREAEYRELRCGDEAAQSDCREGDHERRTAAADRDNERADDERRRPVPR